MCCAASAGVEGGYSLAKVPEEITLGEVIRLLDGPLAPIPCVSVTSYERCSCPDEASCGLHIAMKQVRDAIAGILDAYPLSRLLGEVQKHREDEDDRMAVRYLMRFSCVLLSGVSASFRFSS